MQTHQLLNGLEEPRSPHVAAVLRQGGKDTAVPLLSLPDRGIHLRGERFRAIGNFARNPRILFIASPTPHAGRAPSNKAK